MFGYKFTLYLTNNKQSYKFHKEPFESIRETEMLSVFYGYLFVQASLKN